MAQNHYSLYRCGGLCPVALAGETLRDVIESNIHMFAREARLGNAAGTRINRVRVNPPTRDDARIEVVITAQGSDGMPLNPGHHGSPRTASVLLMGPKQTADECAELVWDFDPKTI